MAMIKKIMILAIVLIISTTTFAKNNENKNGKEDKFLDFQHRGVLAVNLGGSMPIPIPNSFSPTGFGLKFCPVVGYEMTMMSEYGFGLMMGLRYEAKGMKADADVFQIYTDVEMKGAKAAGYFTGKNHTEIYNQYLVLPIGIVWESKSKNWEINANFYVAQAIGRSFKGYVSDGYLREGTPTGDKVDITEREYFDFKESVSTFDYGVELGFYRNIYKRFEFNAHVSWGLASLMNKNFTGLPYKMHNVYARIGFSYRLF